MTGLEEWSSRRSPSSRREARWRDEGGQNSAYGRLRRPFHRPPRIFSAELHEPHARLIGYVVFQQSRGSGMSRTPSYGATAILHAVASGRRFGFDIMEATGLTSGTVYPTLDK